MFVLLLEITHRMTMPLAAGKNEVRNVDWRRKIRLLMNFFLLAGAGSP